MAGDHCAVVEPHEIAAFDLARRFDGAHGVQAIAGGEFRVDPRLRLTRGLAHGGANHAVRRRDQGIADIERVEAQAIVGPEKQHLGACIRQETCKGVIFRDRGAQVGGVVIGERAPFRRDLRFGPKRGVRMAQQNPFERAHFILSRGHCLRIQNV